MALLRLGSQERVATLETIRSPDPSVRARPARRTTDSPGNPGVRDSPQVTDESFR